MIVSYEFQSTPPTRGTTRAHCRHGFTQRVSIHAPHEGDDRCQGFFPCSATCFNPRPPRGGRHALAVVRVVAECVSIHAPHEGDDTMRRGLMCGCTSFNPRPPRGGRPVLPHPPDGRLTVSIHAPHEGDDLACPALVERLVDVSIHAPHEGDDSARAKAMASGKVSIHAPHEGDDSICYNILNKRQIRKHFCEPYGLHLLATGTDILFLSIPFIINWCESP